MGIISQSIGGRKLCAPTVTDFVHNVGANCVRPKGTLSKRKSHTSKIYLQTKQIVLELAAFVVLLPEQPAKDHSFDSIALGFSRTIIGLFFLSRDQFYRARGFMLN